MLKLFIRRLNTALDNPEVCLRLAVGIFCWALVFLFAVGEMAIISLFAIAGIGAVWSVMELTRLSGLDESLSPSSDASPAVPIPLPPKPIRAVNPNVLLDDLDLQAALETLQEQAEAHAVTAESQTVVQILSNVLGRYEPGSVAISHSVAPKVTIGPIQPLALDDCLQKALQMASTIEQTVLGIGPIELRAALREIREKLLSRYANKKIGIIGGVINISQYHWQAFALRFEIQKPDEATLVLFESLRARRTEFTQAALYAWLGEIAESAGFSRVTPVPYKALTTQVGVTCGDHSRHALARITERAQNADFINAIFGSEPLQEELMNDFEMRRDTFMLREARNQHLAQQRNQVPSAIPRPHPSVVIPKI